jgi:hypothetical protein
MLIGVIVRTMRGPDLEVASIFFSASTGSARPMYRITGTLLSSDHSTCRNPADALGEA